MKKRTKIMLSILTAALLVCLAVLQGLGIFLPAYDGEIDSFMQSRLEKMEVSCMAMATLGITFSSAACSNGCGRKGNCLSPTTELYLENGV